MSTLVTIIRNSLLAMLALLGLAVGIGMLGYSVLSGPPARSSLLTAEGTITEASRVTRTSRRTRTTNTYFEMTLQAAGGNLTLRVPSVEISELDVRGLIGRPVRAEYDSEQDVYVLQSGTRSVLTYENTLERRRLSFRQYYVDGIALIVASGLLLLLGLFLGYRKLKKAAAAGAGAPPAGG